MHAAAVTAHYDGVVTQASLIDCSALSGPCLFSYTELTWIQSMLGNMYMIMTRPS
jgi:hypothetical protein